MAKVNYEGTFSPSDIARTLNVEVDVVKTWCHLFTDYLSKGAKPIKGVPRKFSLEDLGVFAYIASEWEADPDIESIKIGLNRGNHQEDIFRELVAEATPIFMDTSLIQDGENIGMIFIPAVEHADLHALAQSYKLAGDRLVEVALKNDEHIELISPILFNYRHAVELYLKACIEEKKISHDLTVLLEDFKKMMKSKFNQEPPEWFNSIVQVFVDSDPSSTTFRYGSSNYNEIYIELNHLKKMINSMAQGFDNARNAKYK